MDSLRPTSFDTSRMQGGIGIEPLSEGLGSPRMYGSPFRDINHGTMRPDFER